MLEGVVFDLDGTLMDSMYIWQTVGERYLRSLGLEPAENQAAVFKTFTLEQAAVYEKEHYGLSASAEEIMAGINALVEKMYFQDVKLRPGVEEFLRKLQQAGIPMTVATATDRYLVEKALERCGVRSCFSEIFTCTEIGKGKDQPDIYIAAQDHMGTCRQGTWVFEDALHGAATAFRAGFPVVGVQDPSEENQERLRQCCTVYLEDFREDNLFWEKALA